MKNWIIAIAIAAVYLLVSLWTGRWALTWVIWVGYALYRLTERNDVGREKSSL